MDYVPPAIEYHQEYRESGLVERDPKVTELFYTIFTLLQQEDLTDDQRMSVFTRLLLNESDTKCKSRKDFIWFCEDMYKHFIFEHDQRAEERRELGLS